ncbi:unnamed protein product [Adineta steineri]|uniref:EGF-like domain-containing protein n=1 Tax=Adineta steineri TaxID=433720 RepID=A0A813XP70_9BILA|nr:unnamed protein product [Adineta steineri]
MIKFIVFNALFVFINGELKSNILCLGQNTTSKSVIDYCLSQNGRLESRCCLSSNSTQILAIDLTDMNLNKVPSFSEYNDLITVNMIDLRINPQLKSSENEDFLRMQSLNYLFLPKQLPCPGNEHVWKIINQTIDPIGIACIEQKDFCLNSTYTCPALNSYCVTNGPNHYLCLCKDGYHGYKCLRHGEFPKLSFFGITVVITIVLSTFFYLTQRRNIKKD